jgi:hypothetical protein
MAACRSAIERKAPRWMRCRVILERKFSTVQRGWRRQPGQHFGMLVGGIIVKDDMDWPAGRDLTLDSMRKRMNSRWRCRYMQRRITVPSSTLSAANRVVVPCRL